MAERSVAVEKDDDRGYILNLGSGDASPEMDVHAFLRFAYRDEYGFSKVTGCSRRILGATTCGAAAV
ncbi:MAG TPA: hypothetical protein PLZ65_10305 [Limnochordia bacterium]|nr:hypothetical protein [Limnochordia bacterium]